MSDRASLNILIVDDSLADSKLMRLWLRDSRCVSSVNHVTGGRAALRYVLGQAEFAQRVRPNLMLLDSNLPDMHGLEVLEEIRRDARLADIDCLMLSGTFHEKDAQRAQELGVVEYRIKPFEADDFENFVRRLEQWCDDRSGS